LGSGFDVVGATHCSQWGPDTPSFWFQNTKKFIGFQSFEIASDKTKASIVRK
jgi:hypothetical protein